MADKKIGEATHDDAIGGSEKIPMDDAGVAKYATTGDLKDYTISRIEAIASASGIDLSNDGVYLLKEGSLKPVGADILAAAVLDYGFGKAAVASLNGNETIGVKDASVQKTITVGSLKTWLESNMTVVTDVDIGTKSACGTLASGDLLLIAQSGSNKKVTLMALSAYANVVFKDYVSGLTQVENLQNTDILYVVNGTTAKKCTVGQLKVLVGAGDVIAPDTHTAGNIPAWDNTNKKLTSGYGVATQISNTPSASKLVTEAAVSGAVSGKVDAVSGKGLSTNDYTTTEKNKLAGLSNASDMTGATAGLDGAHGLVPKPFIADRGKYLRGDGSWAVPEGASAYDMTGATSSSDGVHGLVPAPTSAERDKFLKGDGTWGETASPNDMTGATTLANGVHGLVPAPLIADKDKFLKGDGTWGAVQLPVVDFYVVSKVDVSSGWTVNIASGDKKHLVLDSSVASFTLNFIVEPEVSGCKMYTFPISYVSEGATFTITVKINNSSDIIIALPQGVSTVASLFSGTYGVLTVRVMVDFDDEIAGVSFLREAYYTEAE